MGKITQTITCDRGMPPTGIPDFDRLPFLLTPRQVEELGVKKVATLQQERHEGRGLPFVKVGTSVRYRKPDVIAFIDAHTFNSTREAKLMGAA